MIFQGSLNVGFYLRGWDLLYYYLYQFIESKLCLHILSENQSLAHAQRRDTVHVSQLAVNFDKLLDIA